MLLLAVSGGIDSMCLCEKVRLEGGPFAIAHCNFGLRAEESDADEAFVRKRSEEYGVKCHVKRFDTKTYADKNGISIEMAARELRYRWFGELCSAEGYEAVAVAHNANDNAETLILNLLRGTGLKGVTGMKEEGFLPVPEYSHIPLRRPLLKMTREEILAFMEERGLPWREDSTNAENDYKRNKIRNLVFPVFKEINPSFVRTLNKDMERISRELSEPETVAEAPDRKGFGLSGEYLMREEEWSGEEDVRQKTGCSIVDAELCGEPIVGKWQDGDWFRPIGAPGRKKLQDWFSDRHFTIEDKRAVPILRDPEDPSHVLAIIGFAVDKSVKVSQKTKRIYRFCLIPEL